MQHPKSNPNGQPVKIHHPSQATASSTWDDWRACATFTPGGIVPSILNDVAVRAIGSASAEIDWNSLILRAQFDEPPFTPPPGYKIAAGAVVLEPHGRVWVVHPTNGFGGYLATFPKGRPAPGTTLQETAVREVFEESGLVVEVFGFLADSKRSTSFTRYYLARRVAGSPADMSWESQAVSLVPLNQLTAILNQPVDHAIVAALQARSGEWGKWFWGTGPIVDGHKVATRYSWQRQSMPEQHVTLQVDFRLDAREVERIRQGFIPAEMEDHWFAYFENNTLYHHRSWTGFLIYRLHCVPDGDGLRAICVDVNRDPRQYENTDDAEDCRFIEILARSLAQVSANETLKDHFAENLSKIQQPNYLGSPDVVQQEVIAYLNTVVGQWLSMKLGQEGPNISYQDLIEANSRLAAIFSGQDPAYTVIGDWNSAEQLGSAVVRYFDLDPDYFAGENLFCILSEGLAGLSLVCKGILQERMTQEANWERDIQPHLQQLAWFVSTVLMGTNVLFFPDKTLKHFSEPCAL